MKTIVSITVTVDHDSDQDYESNIDNILNAISETGTEINSVGIGETED